MLHAVDKQGISRGESATPDLSMLRLDKDVFILQRSDIANYDAIPELDISNRPRHSLGTFRFSGQEVPVYSLSDELEFQEHLPEGRNMCVVINGHSRLIGLVCNELNELDYIMLNVQSMPDCMKHESSPIQELCVYQLKDASPAIGKMLSADAIESYIRLY